MATSRALPDLKARLKIDTGDAPKATTSVQQLARSLRSELSTSAGASISSLDKMRGRLDAMIADLEKTGRGSTDAAKQLRALRTRVDENAHSLGVAGHAAETTEAQTGKLSGGVTRLHESLGRLGPIGLTASQSLDQLGLGAVAAEAGIGGLAAAGVGAAAVLSFKLAQSASDLNEQLTASRVVFGATAAQIENYAKSMAAAGLSEKDALQATTAIATSLKAVGFTDESLSRISKTLVSLATDLSSFSNIPVPEALEGIQAALRGEFDPLERFGIHLNADAVAAEAVKEGLVKSTAEMTAGAKAAATINLIYAQTTTQQNDVARSGGTLASNIRAMDAEVDNLKVDLGQGVLPVFVKITGALLQMIDAVRNAGHWYDSLTGKADSLQKILVMQHPFVHSLADAIGRLADQHQRGTTAVTDYAAGQAKVGDVTKPTTSAIEAQTKALQNLHDTVLGTVNADLQYQTSQLSTKDAVSGAAKAQTDLNDATKAYGPNSQQAKDAQEALDKAQLDVYQSALQQATAAEQLHQKWAEEAGGTLTAAQAADVQIDSLRRVQATVAPGSPLWNTLDGYINKLQTQIPREIQTHFDVYFTSSGAVTASGEAFIPRAGGGSLIPGHAYTIGEYGPERVIMGSNGGYVIPNGGQPGPSPAPSSSTYVTNVTGVAADPATLARMIAREQAWQARVAGR